MPLTRTSALGLRQPGTLPVDQHQTVRDTAVLAERTATYF